MAAHRYWGVDLYSRGGWVTIKEIEMRDAIGGADVTGSGASFGPANGFDAGGTERLFDNNNTTVWGLFLVERWARVGYDFGTPTDIVEVLIRTNNFGSAEPVGITLSYSDDGFVFTTLAPYISVANNVAADHIISGFSEPVAPRIAMTAGRLSPGWPSGSPGGRVAPSHASWDSIDSGPLSIAGTVKIDDDPDIPIARRVRLFEKATGRLVREKWSAADGSYSFTRIKDNKYFLVAHDHTLNDNAAIKDEIRPQAPA
jgi:hypothetical protein